MKVVLEFADVRFARVAPYEMGLNGVSFAVREGELCLIRLSEGAALTPVADLACGVLEPESGEVQFDGAGWRRRSADEASAARARIGRVFERAGWLSNLDVDENVTLPQRFHARRRFEDVMREAREVAEELGLAAIPDGRPATVERATLLKAQWVRALLGTPRLLILERPARDLPAGETLPLAQAVNRRRERHGTAVLWITDAHERLDASALRPTKEFAMEDGSMTLLPV